MKKKKNSLIGHNKPPRKHNYPKFRKLIKQFDPFDPHNELYLADVDEIMKMNSKTLQKHLNQRWRAWKKREKRFKKWDKRMKRIDRRIEKHRLEMKIKAMREWEKNKNKKEKIRARDITWISY